MVSVCHCLGEHRADVLIGFLMFRRTILTGNEIRENCMARRSFLQRMQETSFL